MVTKVSDACGVIGKVPEVIWQFAIDTSWPSYDSGANSNAPIVTVAGVGNGPEDTTVMPYGEVIFSSDSVMSSRCLPPLKAMRPTTSTIWPGVVDENGVAVSLDRKILIPPVPSCTWSAFVPLPNVLLPAVTVA